MALGRLIEVSITTVDLQKGLPVLDPSRGNDIFYILGVMMSAVMRAVSQLSRARGADAG